MLKLLDMLRRKRKPLEKYTPIVGRGRHGRLTKITPSTLPKGNANYAENDRLMGPFVTPNQWER